VLLELRVRFAGDAGAMSGMRGYSEQGRWVGRILSEGVLAGVEGSCLSVGESRLDRGSITIETRSFDFAEYRLAQDWDGWIRQAASGHQKSPSFRPGFFG
jgi:hypothetical protein